MKHLNVRKQVFRKLPIYTWPTVLFSVKWTNCWAELNYLSLTEKSEIVPEKTFQCLDCEIKKLLSSSLLSWAYKTYILNAMAFLLPWVSLLPPLHGNAYERIERMAQLLRSSSDNWISQKGYIFLALFHVLSILPWEFECLQEAIDVPHVENYASRAMQ